MGPVGILLSVGISYIVAAIFVIFGLSMNTLRRNQFIPFAPFLAIGALIIWFFGNDQIIMSVYGIWISHFFLEIQIWSTYNNLIN